MSDTRFAFLTGDVVQVFNPGPRAIGVVVANVRPRASYARVRWDDDGTEGFPRADLLRLLERPTRGKRRTDFSQVPALSAGSDGEDR